MRTMKAIYTLICIFLFVHFLSLSAVQTAWAGPEDVKKIAKSVSKITGFWEMMGGFVAVSMVGFTLYRVVIYFLKKMDYIKDPILEEIETLRSEVLSLREHIESQRIRTQPFSDRLLPAGIPLEQTPFYKIIQRLEEIDQGTTEEIVKILRVQQRQSGDIIRVLRFIASSGDADKAKSIDLLLGNRE